MTQPPLDGGDVPAPGLTFKVSGLRAVLHLAEPVLTGLKFVRLVSSLGAWASRLSNDPRILPSELADDDIPLVLWRSPGNEWQCEVRRRRIDLMWRLGSPDGAAVVPAEFYGESVEAFLTILESTKQRPTALGSILERYSPCAGSAAMTLARHFCNADAVTRPGPIYRSDTFMLSSHKVFAMHGIRVNSWVHNKSARLSNSNQDIVLVTTDINTIRPGNKEAQQPLDLKSFFVNSVATSAEVVQLYYRGSAV